MIAHVVELEADGNVRGGQANDVDGPRVRDSDGWRVETWVKE